MSTPNPALVAAAPALLAVIAALEQFSANIGPDPMQWAVKVGPALEVLGGQVGLQLPVLVQAEAGVGLSAFNAKLSGWSTQLKALTPTAPAA